MKPKDKKIRLNRLLSERGILSRRKADEYISTGRIKLHGETVRVLGTKVDPDETDIEIDDIPIDNEKVAHIYVLLHKPAKVMCTLNDPEGRSTVVDFVKQIDKRIYPVGRLDYNSEGLLLLTNNGKLANKLAHPSFGKKKKYLVKVKGIPSKAVIERLKKGIRLRDGWIRPSSVRLKRKLKANAWVEIVIKEGRNQILRRTFEKLQYPVLRLIRTEFGALKLGTLKQGQTRKLSRKEAHDLLEKS